MIILVTGSEGFIGRNLVKKLKDEGHIVLEFDTKHFDPEHLFTTYVDYNDLIEIDYIFHLGAISGTTEKNVDKINRYNTKFSIDLFEMSITYGIPIVYASSASVYGNTMKDGQYIYNPLNYYAASKVMIDMWVSENYDRFSKVVGLRFFNVYGADERKDDMSTSPIYRFTQQAKYDGVIKIFKGSQHTYRDFVCVEDVVQSMLWARDKANPHIYDVGTSNPISFMDVAEMISDKYNAPIKFIEMPKILEGQYQTYTKANPDVPLMYNSVSDWLKLR